MEPEFVDYPTALRILGASKATLNNRIRDLGIPTYPDARDRRRRLLALADVLRMTTRRPEPADTQPTRAA